MNSITSNSMRVWVKERLDQGGALNITFWKLNVIETKFMVYAGEEMLCGLATTWAVSACRGERMAEYESNTNLFDKVYNTTWDWWRDMRNTGQDNTLPQMFSTTINSYSWLHTRVFAVKDKGFIPQHILMLWCIKFSHKKWIHSWGYWSSDQTRRESVPM